MGILSNGGKETLIQQTQRGRDDDGDDSVTKRDLDKLRKQIEGNRNKESSRDQMLETGRKAFNSVRHGVLDVAKSLNTPDSKKRPRIARIPNLRKADISGSMNLERLKQPGLVGHDIRGKKIKLEPHD
jgi:hypothetical protein